MTVKNAEELKERIISAVSKSEGEIGIRDLYGTRFFCDIEISFDHRPAMLRTAWIIRSSEDFPRSTTSYTKTTL